MTSDDLKALLAAYNASTKGEWVAKVQSVDQGEYDEDHMTLHFADVDWMTFYEHENDAPFIALAHNSLPALLQHVERMEDENRRLRSLADFVASRHPDGNPKFAIEAARELLEALAGGQPDNGANGEATG